MTIDYTGIATLVASVGATAVAIRNGWRVNDTKHAVGVGINKIDTVHAEVATSNGTTVGALIEQNLAPSADGSVATLAPDDKSPAPG
jgi:hypothetical protein